MKELNTFNDFRQQFQTFYNTVKKLHIETKNIDHGGHGLDHDITVAMLSLKIATEIRTSQKAWCSSMLHSVDRLVTKDEVRNTMVSTSESLKDFFGSFEIEEIIEAAFRHSEINRADQNETQITLMDADRLANMQSAVIIRSGQYRINTPVLDFNYLNGEINPESIYENPKTVVDGLRLVVTRYIPQLRLPKAKQLGYIYSKRLTEYIQSIEDDYKYLGLQNITI